MTPGLAGGLRDPSFVLRDPAPHLLTFAGSGLPRFPGDPRRRRRLRAGLNAGPHCDAVAASRGDAMPMPPRRRREFE